MRPEQEQYVLKNIGRKSVEALSKDLGIKERKIKKFLDRQKGRKDIPPTPPVKNTIRTRNTFLSVILILVLGFCAYGNSIKGQFLFDDNMLVTGNRFITDWNYLDEVFKEDLNAGAGKEGNSYRPFQVLTYMVDYSFWKLDPRGYHLTNILCHIFAAFCVYGLIQILFDDQFLALFTSLLFVVHPIHTQAVSYIAGRADCLAAIFILTSFIFYVKQGARKDASFYALMLLSYALAILSRENSLFLPIFLLVYHYVFKKRIQVREYVSLFGMALGYFLLRATILTYLMPETPMHRTTLFERIPGFFVALAKYMQLLVWPVGLHMEYGEKLFKYSDPLAIAGAIVLLFLAVLIWRSRQRNQLVLFSVLWFLVTLLPMSNIYPLNAYMAEHWMYLPSIGFFLLVAKGFSILYGKKHFLAVTVIVGGGLLCFYAFLTFRQNAEYWREPISFYQRTIKYAPDSINAYTNLGQLYYEEGRKEEAIALFKKAIEINPRAAYAYNNLGAVSHEPGVNDEYVIGLFKNAVKYDPYHASARYNLGKLYTDIGQTENAIPEFKKAIELDPYYVEAYDKLGTIYGKAGQWEEAIAMFQKAIAIDPHFATSQTNLSIAYFYDKQYDLAIRHCDKALKLGSQFPAGFLEELEPYRSSHLLQGQGKP